MDDEFSHHIHKLYEKYAKDKVSGKPIFGEGDCVVAAREASSSLLNEPVFRNQSRNYNTVSCYVFRHDGKAILKSTGARVETTCLDCGQYEKFVKAADDGGGETCVWKAVGTVNITDDNWQGVCHEVCDIQSPDIKNRILADFSYTQFDVELAECKQTCAMCYALVRCNSQ
mmetsp:Transcript_39295/g.70384  ORF Transcript_39295/g.70384 Transcript_39295/m.70384 type:complete len:171 (-) Transcript_39295:814-1326(-)